MRTLIATVVSACAWAQTGLDRPQLGTMLDVAGAARPVYGVAGSVTLGEATATEALSIACSRQFCLIKTGSSILSAAGATGAPPGPAMFALDGEAAWVYFPQSKQFARWHDQQLDCIDFSPGGEVLSLRAGRGAIEFAVRRDGGVWIVRGHDVVDSLPDAAGPVLLLKDGMLFANAAALTLRRSDGTQVQFDVQGAEALFDMGEGYVQVRAGQSNYSVRIEPGREQVFLLPEAPL